MPQLYRSSCSHEEIFGQKQTVDRQWMEALEPRVMLSGDLPILSPDQPITAELPPPLEPHLYEFIAEAGERYAFEETSGARVEVRVRDLPDWQSVQCPDGCRPMPYTGTYRILVHNSYELSGTYTLQARRIFDGEGNVSAAAPYAIGTSVAGSIDYAGDVDGFLITAAAGETYSFAALGTESTAYLDIFRSNGEAITDSHRSRVEWVAPAAGDYYLRVASWKAKEDYTLFSNVQQIVNPTTPGAASPLPVGETVKGTVGAGESKYFAFQAKSRGTYRVYISDTSGEGVVVGRISPDGVWLETSDVETYPWTSHRDEIYFLWVRGYNPLSGESFSIRIEEDLDDHGDSAAEATPLQLGAHGEGTVQYFFDDDWFAFAVEEGERYVFNFQGKGTTGFRRRKGAWPEFWIAIEDENGNSLAARHPAPTGGFKLEWTAEGSSVLYARVRNGYGVAKYSLLAAKAEDDPDPPIPLEIGEIVGSERLSTTGITRFRIVAEAGVVYRLADLSFDVVPADGVYSKHVEWTCADEDCFKSGFTAPASGPYFLEVQPWNADYGTGPFQLVQRVSAHHKPEPAEPPEVIESLSGELADDEDVLAYGFEAQKGKSYVFATLLKSLEDSTLTLYGPDGEILAWNDDAGLEEGDWSSRLEWKAEQGGTYYIVVGGYGAGTFDLQAYEQGGDGAAVAITLQALSAEDTTGLFVYGYDDVEDGWGVDDESEIWFDDDEELDFEEDDWEFEA